MEFSKADIRKLLESIFSGEISTDNLPEDLYFAIADYLKKALYDGFGGDLEDFEFGSNNLELLQELRENIYMFSGAKTYQQVRDMTDLVAQSETFKDFYEGATAIYDLYNESWAEIGRAHV